MEISPQTIQNLRQATGVGMLDCKKALDEADGDVNKAMEILRKRGEVKAAKKLEERESKEGIIYSYIHANNRIGTMLELNCESDFVARNEVFVQLAHDLAMQIAATNPLYVSPEDVPAEIVAKEKEIYSEEVASANKPPEIVEKIIEGKLGKFYDEVCLLRQSFIKDDSITIDELIKQKIASLGEKIVVKKFVRYEV